MPPRPYFLRTPSQRIANRRLGWKLAVAAFAMCGFGYLLVPLYQSYCDKTGFNGAAGHIDYSVAVRHTADTARWVTVEFVTDTAGSLPWEFSPEVVSVRVHPGELVTTRFRARNLGASSMIGQAVPSVTPGAAAPYFYNVDGICSAPQALAPGERKDLALQFLVDPKLPPDIGTLTLGVAFFEAQPLRTSLPQLPLAARRRI